MTESLVCRLLIDPPADGAWNMAVDEALLDEVASSRLPVLRFYQWQRPTLSLGYFQVASDRLHHATSQSAQLVRRQTGGGAILHDREVTYSLILPTSFPVARDTQELYNTVHQTLSSLLQEQLTTCSETWRFDLCAAPDSRAPQNESFLCFHRRSIGDILLFQDQKGPRHKIVGSAQRRRRGAVLQHGSVLLEKSPLAPELPGIVDLTGVRIAADSITSLFPSRLALALGLELDPATLQEETYLQAKKLCHEKFKRGEWTKRR